MIELGSCNNMVACICEGTAEQVILRVLLDKGLLIFDKNDLLSGELIRSRSGKKFENEHLRMIGNNLVTVYRILDSHKENFKINSRYIHKINKIYNVLTHPEIEILIILNEGCYNDFCKYHKSPSDYCKEVLHYGDVKTKEFAENYFVHKGENIDNLMYAIREYRRVTKISRKENELMLYDIINWNKWKNMINSDDDTYNSGKRVNNINIKTINW